MTGEEAYEKYCDELIRFATGLVGPADAADLVMDTMVRCIYGTRWAEVADPHAYLHRAVLHRARNHYRATVRRRARERAASPPQAIWPLEIRPEVLQAVARLSMRQRAVIFLTYWSDLPPPAVALTLGISEGSVRRHLARARTRLKELLDD